MKRIPYQLACPILSYIEIISTVINSFFIRLPFLHPELATVSLMNGKHFWPFPSHAPDDFHFWQPEALPLSLDESYAFCTEIIHADSSELERQRQILLTKPFPPASQSENNEMAQLAEFGKTGELPAENKQDELFFARESQSFLLRLWTLEEKMLEINSLEEKCASLDGRLLAGLLEDTEDWLPASHHHFKIDLSLMPDWDMVAQHLLHFIPQELPLLIEGAKAADINAQWLPAREFLPDIYKNDPMLLACRASLASIGKRAYKNFAANLERLWLIMEE